MSDESINMAIELFQRIKSVQEEKPMGCDYDGFNPGTNPEEFTLVKEGELHSKPISKKGANGIKLDLTSHHYGLDIAELQGEIRKWREHNFQNATSVQQFLGVVEEVGELAHAMLKEMQGIREGAHMNGHRASTEESQMDAVGDIAIFLINFCTMKGWSFRRILQDTWREVGKRDFKKYPKNGVSA